MDFSEQYGPWAVVAGASEGVGATFASAVAARGLNVVLLARRQQVLDEVAAAIEAEHGVRARAVAVDLAEADAADRVAEATADLDVGLFMYNAGADADFRPFLANTAEAAVAMVHRNCVVPTALSHLFAGPMADRGSGGIILVGSGAGFAGAPNMVSYAATKAFDMVLAEGLWAELHPRGVDVLGLVLGETDTPALRRLREGRGLAAPPGVPLPGAASADDVVADAIEHLGDGPVWVYSEPLYAASRFMGSVSRRQAVEFMIQASAATMGADD